MSKPDRNSNYNLLRKFWQKEEISSSDIEDRVRRTWQNHENPSDEKQENLKITPPDIKNIGEIVFDCYFVNFAWGYKFTGFCVNRSGQVYTYEPDRDYWSNLYDVPEILTGSEFRRKLINHKSAGEIQPDKLREMIALILPASKGEMVFENQVACDAGCVRFVAYIYDSGNDIYRTVLLHQGGDDNVINTSNEAETLYDWLSELMEKIDRAQRDEVLAERRNQPLCECPYLYLDLQYRKLHDGNQTQDATILCAAGVTIEGALQSLGVSISVGKHEEHWIGFLTQLENRGLSGVRLIISDSYAGLDTARKAVFDEVPFQRCQFHLQQEAKNLAPHPDLQEDIARELRTVFDAPDLQTAQSRLAEMVEMHYKSTPRLARWLEREVPDGLTVFSFPTDHQKHLKNTNIFRGAIHIPTTQVYQNEEACLRSFSEALFRFQTINANYIPQM